MELFTRIEAAARLRIGLTLLAEETAAGKIGSIRINKRRLYRAVDLERYIEAHESASAAA